MNLLELRTQFVEVSGRLDLVNPEDYSDNGANFYINAGLKALERLAFINFKLETTEELVLNSGEYQIALTKPARLITMATAISSDRGEVILRRRTIKEIAALFKKPLEDISPGFPCYWTFVPNTGESLINTVSVVPAPSEQISVAFTGQFHSPDFVEDTDENFWSVTAPELLLKAALWQLEIFYRNTAGSKDWLNAITIELANLDMDGVARDTNHINQMEG